MQFIFGKNLDLIKKIFLKEIKKSFFAQKDAKK
jgi:hypothetical protein